MKALIWPTEPLTTMSTPFIEMPQRAEALPSMTSSPPCAVAPADWLASPCTCTMPDIMFSATPVPALPLMMIVAPFHAGAVIAGVAVDRDGDRRVDPDRHAHARRAD